MMTGRQGSDRVSSDGQGQNLLAPGLVLSVVVLGALLHPNPLAMGLLSVLLTIAGFLIAALVLKRSKWYFETAGDKLVLPSFLLFVGLVAAMLCDADRAAQLMTHL